MSQPIQNICYIKTDYKNYLITAVGRTCNWKQVSEWILTKNYSFFFKYHSGVGGQIEIIY